MNEFIKRHKVPFTMGVILCLVTLNVYLYKDSQHLSGIRNELETANNLLNRDIRDSRVREARYLRQIRERNRTIDQLDRKIMQIQLEKRSLKKELTGLRHSLKIAENQNNSGLLEYKEQMNKLSSQLELTLKKAGETEKALGFFRRKSKKQAEVITRQELVYLECRDQLTLKAHKLDRLNVAMRRLDRHHKRKYLKKGAIKYTIGIVVGLVAGYFVFKSKR